MSILKRAVSINTTETLFEVDSNHTSEAYLKPSRTSEMELFAKIVNGFQPLTIFAKSSTLGVQLGAEYASIHIPTKKRR